MKNCWVILILAALLQSFSVLVHAGSGNQGGHGGLAQILAAGLIVQLLANRQQQHGHHHHHEGRHSGADIHSGRSQYGFLPEAWGAERNPITPQATYASGSWVPSSPMDIAYSHAQYREPTMETYNAPYFYRPPGLW